MNSRSKPPCVEPSVALRQRSPDRLREELTRYMIASEREVNIDWRDMLVDLAPFYDCAQRLALDPVELFESASSSLDKGRRELVNGFARRSDITLRAFGWKLVTTSEGPCYRWGQMRGD